MVILYLSGVSLTLFLLMLEPDSRAQLLSCVDLVSIVSLVAQLLLVLQVILRFGALHDALLRLAPGAGPIQTAGDALRSVARALSQRVIAGAVFIGLGLALYLPLDGDLVMVAKLFGVPSLLLVASALLFQSGAAALLHIADARRCVADPTAALPGLPPELCARLRRRGRGAGLLVGLAFLGIAVELAVGAVVELQSLGAGFELVDGLVLALFSGGSLVCAALAVLFGDTLRRFGAVLAGLVVRTHGLASAARGRPDYTTTRPDVETLVARAGVLRGTAIAIPGILLSSVIPLAVFIGTELLGASVTFAVLGAVVVAPAVVLRQLALGLLALTRRQDALLTALELGQPPQLSDRSPSGGVAPPRLP